MTKVNIFSFFPLLGIFLYPLRWKSRRRICSCFNLKNLYQNTCKRKSAEREGEYSPSLDIPRSKRGICCVRSRIFQAFFRMIKNVSKGNRTVGRGGEIAFVVMAYLQNTSKLYIFPFT